jgi:hypothetical protein
MSLRKKEGVENTRDTGG